MLHFNELYVTDDGKKLVIDVEIDNFSFYDECYIKSIVVDIGDNCDRVGLWKEPVLVYEDNGTDHKQHIRKCLSALELTGLVYDTENLSPHLFVVKAIAEGSAEAAVAAEELGCGWDTNELVGAAYNGYPIYSSFINSAKGLSEDCDRGIETLADFALRYQAFDFALRTGQWCDANYYFRNYLINQSATIKSGRSSGCGCHGQY